MKITKLMLSAFVAAIALVACNKEDLTPSGTGMKSIEISIENMVMTKAPAGEKITSGQAVNVNNFKIILTDASYSNVYTAYDATGQNQASFYWTAADFSGGEIEAEFHFVDSKCTRVIAIANAGDITLEQLNSLTKSIADQQDQDNLVLIADKVLERVADDPATTDVDESVHSDASGKYTEVYKADLTLVPTISRFEVDGFRIKFSEIPKFNAIQVTDIAFDHYWPTVDFDVVNGVFGGVPTGDHVKAVKEPTDDAEVYDWFTTIASLDRWYKDSFTDVTMTPSAPAKNVDPRAYHFFSGKIIPTMYIKLIADGDPAYVWTSVYKKADGTTIDHIEPGKIYRMSAKGEVEAEDPDGSIEIPDDLDPIQRCLDVTVDVVDWAVVLVTPDFTNNSTQAVSE